METIEIPRNWKERIGTNSVSYYASNQLEAELFLADNIDKLRELAASIGGTVSLWWGNCNRPYIIKKDKSMSGVEILMEQLEQKPPVVADTNLYQCIERILFEGNNIPIGVTTLETDQSIYSSKGLQRLTGLPEEICSNRDIRNLYSTPQMQRYLLEIKSALRQQERLVEHQYEADLNPGDARSFCSTFTALWLPTRSIWVRVCEIHVADKLELVTQ